MILAMIQKIGVLVILGVVNDAQAQSPLVYRSAPDQPSLSQAMLDAHNVVRTRVGVPPLIWSDELAAVAQDWANYLIATNAFGHRPNNRYAKTSMRSQAERLLRPKVYSRRGWPPTLAHRKIRQPATGWRGRLVRPLTILGAASSG